MHRIILAITMTCLAVPTIGQAQAQALSKAERAAIRSDVTQSAEALFDAFRRLDADGFLSPYGSATLCGRKTRCSRPIRIRSSARGRASSPRFRR